MSELDRKAWAREAHRIEKQIRHRRERVSILELEIRELELEHDTLIRKIANAYAEENE